MRIVSFIIRLQVEEEPKLLLMNRWKELLKFNN